MFSYIKKKPVINYSLIMLSSITYAYKARNYLNTKGISVKILRTPSEYSERGCGYSIKIQGDADALAEELKNKGIKVIGVVKL